jgi:hypothetical protein
MCRLPWAVIRGASRFTSFAETLKMATALSSETLVSTYKSTQRYNSEDQHRHVRRRENLKSQISSY